VAYGGGGGCQMSRLPYFLDSLLTDDDEVVSFTRRPVFFPDQRIKCFK
jgi:hypothetical protein